MAKAAKVLGFDNLEDVKGKFVNTICYHDGKAFHIKDARHSVNHMGNYINGKFAVVGNHYKLANKLIELDDPLLNYKDYNIGYANCPAYAMWWYRVPFKQYQQGLKKDQMHYVASDPYIVGDEGFHFNAPVIFMLENKYPTMEDCASTLKQGKTQMMAFHKDFALSWDKAHEDLVLEYRGKKVGASIGGSLKEFKLAADYKHLAEALMEAI